MADFERTSMLNNGFFYTFTYDAHKPVKRLVDYHPFIYCIGPVGDPKHNLFAGLNLHHISIEDRQALMKILFERYNYMSQETEQHFSEHTLNRLVPGIGLGVRVYNRANVYDLKRVKNKAVALYIFGQGDTSIATPDDTYFNYLIKNAKHKTSEDYA